MLAKDIYMYVFLSKSKQTVHKLPPTEMHIIPISICISSHSHGTWDRLHCIHRVLFNEWMGKCSMTCLTLLELNVLWKCSCLWFPKDNLKVVSIVISLHLWFNQLSSKYGFLETKNLIRGGHTSGNGEKETSDPFASRLTLSSTVCHERDSCVLCPPGCYKLNLNYTTTIVKPCMRFFWFLKEKKKGCRRKSE